MLARLTLLLIALPALALAADSGGGRAPAPSTAPAASPATAAPVVTPPAPASNPADPAECRMGCAQTYYFCRASDHPDSCAETWGQCVATCNSPDLSSGYSTAP